MKRDRDLGDSMIKDIVFIFNNNFKVLLIFIIFKISNIEKYIIL